MSEQELQEERRRGDLIVLDLVREVHAEVKATRKELAQHINEEPGLFAAAFARGFPDGDPDGHRKVHEAHIKREIDRAEFWKKLTFELTKWGLFGFLGWAVYALWQALLQGPHK